MRISVLTVEWNHQVDGTCLYPWPDLVKVRNEGGVVHNTVESDLVGHVYPRLGSGEYVCIR